jgi:hypothetical protein
MGVAVGLGVGLGIDVAVGVGSAVSVGMARFTIACVSVGVGAMVALVTLAVLDGAGSVEAKAIIEHVQTNKAAMSTPQPSPI